MSELDDYPEEEITNKKIKELLDNFYWEYVAPLERQLQELGHKPKRNNGNNKDFMQEPRPLINFMGFFLHFLFFSMNILLNSF